MIGAWRAGTLAYENARVSAIGGKRNQLARVIAHDNADLAVQLADQRRHRTIHPPRGHLVTDRRFAVRHHGKFRAVPVILVDGFGRRQVAQRGVLLDRIDSLERTLFFERATEYAIGKPDQERTGRGLVVLAPKRGVAPAIDIAARAGHPRQIKFCGQRLEQGLGSLCRPAIDELAVPVIGNPQCLAFLDQHLGDAIAVQIAACVYWPPFSLTPGTYPFM